MIKKQELAMVAVVRHMVRQETAKLNTEIARLQAEADTLATALRKIVGQDMAFLNGYVMANVIKREDILAGRSVLSAAGKDLGD